LEILNIQFKILFLQKEISMTNKIYYLASCSTCRKIIKSLPNSDRLKFHDIRENPITEQELEELHSLSGSYEALFSKKAQLYKTLDLKNKDLTEDDYKKYLLQHYTFLSRPVIIFNDVIFIGNAQPNILKLTKAMASV
jgi:arsenate reductase